jgi:hypothetical protein
MEETVQEQPKKTRKPEWNRVNKDAAERLKIRVDDYEKNMKPYARKGPLEFKCPGSMQTHN